MPFQKLNSFLICNGINLQLLLSYPARFPHTSLLTNIRGDDMDAVTKKIVRKSAFLFLMLTVSVAGIHRIMMRTAYLPAAWKTAAERTPVIVLDAGHGESTKT